MSQLEVLMPSMGEGVHEATLVKWLKSAGEKVQEDEPLLEVSTDKVDTEIPSPFSGFLVHQKAAEGDTITVDQVLAILSSESSSPGEVKVLNESEKPTSTDSPAIHTKSHNSQDTKEPSKPISSSPSNPDSSQPTSKSSPVVRKIARERGIDLKEVQGSGIQGRITKKDLDHYLKETSKKATTRKIPGSDRRPKSEGDLTSLPSIPPEESSIAVQQSAKLSTTFQNGQEYLEGVPVNREKMTKMRSIIADHMVSSVRTSPHVTTVFEIDLKRVVESREQSKSAFLKQEGFKLTFTPFLLHAATLAIKKFPIINCSVDGQEILYKKDINLGCAVALPNGLIVPVIKNAEELNLNGLARRLNDLVVRARNKKLNPEDVRGGTFTVTNPGGYGSITSNPIINQPQVAILGIGAIIKKPVVLEGDAIGIRPMMLVSLTFDHRVIDGETGALFLAEFKRILESYDDSPL